MIFISQCNEKQLLRDLRPRVLRGEASGNDGAVALPPQSSARRRPPQSGRGPRLLPPAHPAGRRLRLPLRLKRQLLRQPPAAGWRVRHGLPLHVPLRSLPHLDNPHPQVSSSAPNS